MVPGPAAVQAWLDAAGFTEGALFRCVRATLSDITLIIQRRAALAGVEGDFDGHNLHLSFIIEGLGKE